MGGITYNPGGSTGEAGVINVTKGRERDPNDFLGCSHYALQGLTAGLSAGAVPHSDAIGQNTLNGAPVKRVHDGGRSSSSPQLPEKVQALLGSFGQCCGVETPGQVFVDVHSQECMKGALQIKFD